MVRLQASISKNDPGADKGMLIATAYRWIKAECDAALFRLQAESIRQIDQKLAALPPAQLVRGDKAGVW